MLFHVHCRANIFPSCGFFAFNFLIALSYGQECFDQQYTNHVVDLRTLHVIQKIAVIAPLGAFHVALPTVGSTADDHGDGIGYFDDKYRTLIFLRKENGELLPIYSSVSSASLEWHTLNVLSSALRIVPAFEADGNDAFSSRGGVSPVVIITACPYKSRAIYLDAQPFVVDSHESGLVSMYENELLVNFRTFESGIFFFSMADQGDLLIAQISGGRVETFFDFGSLTRSSISGGKALNDGEWHELRWTHQFDSVQLFVDKVLVNSTTPSGLYRKLDFNHQIEIGGRPEDQYSVEIQTTFHGCLARVQLNNVDLLRFAPKDARNCQMPQPQMMSLNSGWVQITYSFLPFTLEFRVLDKPTSLISILDAANETLLNVLIDDQRQVSLEAENRQIRQSSIPAISVSDGNWHSASIKLRGGRLDVELDGLTVLWLEGSLVRKIGLRMSAFRLSAVGCYRSTTVDLRSAVFTPDSQVVKDRCLFTEKCLPNPCENGGTCVQTDLNAFRCNCPKHYTGTFCHNSLLPRSCEDYRLRRRPHRSFSTSTSASFSASSQQQHSAAAALAIRRHLQLDRHQHYRGDGVGDVDQHFEYYYVHYERDGDGGETVTIDLDGGGPLRPFKVVCIGPRDAKKRHSGVAERQKPAFPKRRSSNDNHKRVRRRPTTNALDGIGEYDAKDDELDNGEYSASNSDELSDGDYGGGGDGMGVESVGVANVPEATQPSASLNDDGDGGDDYGSGSTDGGSGANALEEEDDSEITLLRNDAPSSGIFVGDGPTEPGAVRRVLDYGSGADGAALDRFVDGFHACRQYMRFECRGGTKLMMYGAERRPSTWYATRNGQHGLQWADAPPYSRMCSCAMNASCDNNRMCNCDSGHDGVDEGFNTYQQLLPVMQLFIGGTSGPKSSANVTIGPLRCQRRRVFEPITFVDRNQQLVGVQTFNGPIFDLYVQLRFAHPLMTVFTWESTNAQRWFQLLVRDGKIVAQLVNAGQSHELASDIPVNDDRWHTVYWEVDRYAMRLAVDRHQKSISSLFLLPNTYTYIIGSRSGRGAAGFAGQMRNFYLAGEELLLTQMVEKLNPVGVQPGEGGYCNKPFTMGEVGGGRLRCANDGECVEYYDRFKCNCSQTPFGGESCEQEVGMWVPLGSHVTIPWQHPSHMSSTCYRMNIHTASSNVSLMRGRALFAESSFNMSLDEAGHLNLAMYDGFFFSHNVTFERFALNDQQMKDVRFCASKTEFRLTVNEEPAMLLEGNFTFFQNFNVWTFIDANFTGCVSRLRIGSGFPLKNPTASRLTHSAGVKFGSCPFDPLDYQKSVGDVMAYGESDGDGSSNSEIQITAIVKSQQRLLLITPAIGLFAALILAVFLCTFVCYVRSRPDGVYKTNETSLIGGSGRSSDSGGSLPAGNAGKSEPLIVAAPSQLLRPSSMMQQQQQQQPQHLYSQQPMMAQPQQQLRHAATCLGGGSNRQSAVSTLAKEYFC